MIAGIFALVLALSLALAARARRGHKADDARSFFVASGQFGPVLFFFLSVGETYSVTSMLGFPGGVYARGDSFVAWFFGYLLLAAPAVYALGPLIRRAGALYGAATMPEFFGRHYRSRTMEVVLALVAIALLLPIGTTQFLGLTMVIASLGMASLPPIMGLVVAGLLAFSYVGLAGLRGSAFVAVLKDALMLGAILLVGLIALFHQADSGLAPPPAPASPTPHDMVFAVTTMLLQASGFVMIPMTWAMLFAARSSDAIRKAQSMVPLYLVMFPLLMIVATYAHAQAIVPARPDLVFIAVAAHVVPAPLFALVLAAIALAGLVMLSGVCMGLAPLVTRNLVSGLDSDHQRRWALVVAAAYLGLSILGTTIAAPLIVWLNNLYYIGMAQSLPALVAALVFPRVTPAALLAGLGLGLASGLALHIGAVETGGINPGILGLVANSATVALLTGWGWRREGPSVLALLREAPRS